MNRAVASKTKAPDAGGLPDGAVILFQGDFWDLADHPGESKPVSNAQMTRKLRGMAVLFQEEMQRDARKAGEWAFPGDMKLKQGR